MIHAPAKSLFDCKQGAEGIGYGIAWYVAQRELTMKTSTMKTLLRGAAVAALASFPLMAADLSTGSGTGSFYALVVGLMATIFGGMTFCYGLVRLAEKIVHTFHARHAVPMAVPPIRHAA